MSDAKTPEEPSIEEILGSIRRIIADDDDAPQPAAPNEGGFSDALNQASATPALAPVTAFADDEDDEPLELNQKIDEDGTIIDMQEPEPLPPAFTPRPSEQSTEDEIVMLDEPENETIPAAPAAETLVSNTAAAATAAVMAKLARSTSVSRSGNDGVTLEDLVKEMVRPMLREWLDQHLPELVQSMVERELERIARRVG